MGRTKEYYTILKVLLIVWIWEPVQRFFGPWVVHFGLRPCCKNRNLRVAGDPKYILIQECLSCGYTRTFSNSWYFFP